MGFLNESLDLKFNFIQQTDNFGNLRIWPLLKAPWWIIFSWFSYDKRFLFDIALSKPNIIEPPARKKYFD